jgi:molecular chaperone IbpA
MIGVDRMADFIDSAMRREADLSYPPYDVEKTSDNGYRIALAAAGFAADELEITAQPNLLIVCGRKAKDNEDGARTFLHRGIAARNFERKFELADYVVVKSARYDNGVLAIDLVREAPPAQTPQRIEIVASRAKPDLPQIDKHKTERHAA